MKNSHIISVLIFALLIVSACKKDESSPVEEVTAEEAAVIIANSFCYDNAGTMTQIEDAVDLSQNVPAGTIVDTTFSITSLPGAIITYQYQVQYSYGFLSADHFQLTYNAAGSCNSLKVTASSDASGILNVSGLVSGNYYSVNGQSGREGSFSLKIGNQNSLTASVSSTVTDFRMNKTTGLIESGTATVSVSGNTSQGKNFSFSGTLVYSGNYTGTLTLEGKQYVINLSSGVIQ